MIRMSSIKEAIDFLRTMLNFKKQKKIIYLTYFRSINFFGKPIAMTRSSTSEKKFYFLKIDRKRF